MLREAKKRLISARRRAPHLPASLAATWVVPTVYAPHAGFSVAQEGQRVALGRRGLGGIPHDDGNNARMRKQIQHTIQTIQRPMKIRDRKMSPCCPARCKAAYSRPSTAACPARDVSRIQREPLKP